MAITHAVHVSIVRLTESSCPGWVECRLIDAAGREWLFEEKVPIVALADHLDAQSTYPQPGSIECQIIERKKSTDGREVVVINTELPWDIKSTTGQTRFEVFAEQLMTMP